MKKALTIIAIALMIFILILTPGCIKQKPTETTQQKKLYEITTYNLSGKDKIVLSALMNNEAGKLLWPYNSVQEFLKDIINGKAGLQEGKASNIFSGIKEGLTKHTYYAKQILSYSDTEARFIGAGSNKELFITADYIKISQTY